MSDKTGIEWTDATWNPVTGCTEVTPGCDHCYAKTFAERWRGTEGHYFENGFDVQLREAKLTEPLRWRKPRKVFVNSMSDLFHDAVPDEYIARVWNIMNRSKQHTFQVLTKRHGRMKSLLNSPEFQQMVWSMVGIGGDTPEWDQYRVWPLPNVWVGVSAEDQQRANLRIPALLGTAAAVRFISAEPLLGPIDLTKAIEPNFARGGWEDLSRLHWVIVGGESGRGARPMEPDWARQIRDDCNRVGIAFLFKQWGEHVTVDQMTPECFTSWDIKHGSDLYPSGVQWQVGKKAAGRLLDERTWDEYPVGVGRSMGEAR
jgi:protein gp37